jgi:uncharacterized DUF497 family protein
MRYAWDPAKDVLNQSKPGLRLAEGIPALEDPSRDSWIDDRFDYGKDRIVTLGMPPQCPLCSFNRMGRGNHAHHLSKKGGAR